MFILTKCLNSRHFSYQLFGQKCGTYFSGVSIEISNDDVVGIMIKMMK